MPVFQARSDHSTSGVSAPVHVFERPASVLPWSCERTYRAALEVHFKLIIGQSFEFSTEAGVISLRIGTREVWWCRGYGWNVS